MSEQIALVVVTIVLMAIMVAIVIICYKANTEGREKVRAWLLYAVTMAEKLYGSGTGKLKLAYVYNLFVDVFPFISSLITSEEFGKMVDEALTEMRKILKTNATIAEIIESKED